MMEDERSIAVGVATGLLVLAGFLFVTGFSFLAGFLATTGILLGLYTAFSK